MLGMEMGMEMEMEMERVGIQRAETLGTQEAMATAT